MALIQYTKRKKFLFARVENDFTNCFFALQLITPRDSIAGEFWSTKITSWQPHIVSTERI